MIFYERKIIVRVAGQKLDAFVKRLLPTDPLDMDMYMYIYIKKRENLQRLIFFSFRPIDLFFNVASRVRFETLITLKSIQLSALESEKSPPPARENETENATEDETRPNPSVIPIVNR